MAKRPLELQSLKWPFVGLAVLLALSAAWSVYDEVVPRRPWKNYQREFFKLDESHLKADRERAQKRLEAPETKKQLDALKAELKAATEAISGNSEQRKEYDAAVKAEDDGRIKEAEAKLFLGFDKSEQDAVYYLLREAWHEGKAKEEQELQKKFDDWQKKIDAIEKPIEELDKRLDAYSGIGKLPAMEQYWIKDLRNSWGSETVDRCQNCHVAINKGGFTAPWEVLSAKKAQLPEADMKAQYALDPEVIDAYQKIHDAICEDVPKEPEAIPIGGYTPPAEPAPMDPAQATECRPRDAWQKWMEMAEAYC